MGSHHPCTLTNMELSKILLLVSSIAAAPQSSFPRIPVARFVEKVQGENYVTDNRVKVAVSSKSPSTAAALAYVNSVVKEGLCGEAAEAYVNSILNGGSKKAAVAEATKAYITAFNSGVRYEAGGACEAADRAWKVARVSGGKDHVLEATLAFIKKWPGVEDGNPCAIAGTDYVKETLAGKSHIEANSAAMKGFIKAFKEKANKGASLNDEACHKHPGLSLMQFLPNLILSLVLALLLSQTNYLLVREWSMILSVWKPWKHLLTPMLLVKIS